MSYSLTVFVNDQSAITPELLAETYKRYYRLDPFVSIHSCPEGFKEQGEDEPAVIVTIPLVEGDSDAFAYTGEFANKWLIIIRFMREKMHPDDKKRILSKARNPLKRSQIAACNRWIYITTSPDPELWYVNEYIYTLQILDEFRGLYVFSDNENKFLSHICEYAQKPS